MALETHRLITEVLQSFITKYPKAIGSNTAEKMLQGNIYDFSPIFEDFMVACADVRGTSLKDNDERKAKYIGATTSYQEVNSRVYTMSNNNQGFFDLPYNDLWVRVDNGVGGAGMTCTLGFHRAGAEHTQMIVCFCDYEGRNKIAVQIGLKHIVSDNKSSIMIEMLQNNTTRTNKQVLDILLNFVAFTFRTFERLSEYNEQRRPQLNIYSEVASEGEKARYVQVRDKKTMKKINSPLKPIYVVLDSSVPQEQAKRYQRNKARTFEYTFSWLVKGHYRNLHNPETMGMSRYGKRDIIGKTWIAPYTKGNKDCPIRTKPETIVLQKEV